MKSPPWVLVAPGIAEIGRSVRLDAAEARHVTGPLRRRPGDEVVLIDGAGVVAHAVLHTAKGEVAEAEIVDMRVEEPQCGEGVTLAMAMVGNRAVDWAIQKAVEIGVRRVLPVVTDRTQVKGGAQSGRAEHWRRVALQALKQSRRSWAMEVADIKPLVEVVDSEIFGRDGVVADREGVALANLPPSAGRLLVVGPEGGFSKDEGRLFTDRGWQRLRLGSNILRTETAAVVGAAMLVARDEGLLTVRGEVES
jgi:16S rRNA (uracil1498-N3)-methyltransferase